MEKEEYTIDSQLKDQINSEGWEDTDGKESYCGLLIGKKETGELDSLLERLETGGRARDLTTYIRLNKKIVLPKEYITTLSPENLSANKGLIWNEGDNNFKYIDNKGNISEIDIEPRKINSLKSAFSEKRSDCLGRCRIYNGEGYLDLNKLYSLIKCELKDLGFDLTDRLDTRIVSVWKDIKNYQENLKEFKKEEIKQDFNF